MKRVLKVAGIAALSIALSACGEKAPEQPVAPATPAPSEPATPEPAPVAPAATQASLPGGFVVPFEHSITKDRTVTLENGKQQRRVQMEVFGKDMKELERQMDEALAAAGYKAGTPKIEGTQRSVNFRRDGQVVVLLVTDATPPIKKVRPDATGTLRLGWNL